MDTTKKTATKNAAKNATLEDVVSNKPGDDAIPLVQKDGIWVSPLPPPDKGFKVKRPDGQEFKFQENSNPTELYNFVGPGFAGALSGLVGALGQHLWQAYTKSQLRDVGMPLWRESARIMLDTICKGDVNKAIAMFRERHPDVDEYDVQVIFATLAQRR